MPAKMISSDSEKTIIEVCIMNSNSMLDGEEFIQSALNEAGQIASKVLLKLKGPGSIYSVIIIAKKVCLAIMPPLHDVERHAGKMYARSTRHDQNDNIVIPSLAPLTTIGGNAPAQWRLHPTLQSYPQTNGYW